MLTTGLTFKNNPRGWVNDGRPNPPFRLNKTIYLAANAQFITLQHSSPWLAFTLLKILVGKKHDV